MKKVLIINPNSSEKMTKDIKETVNNLNLENIEITVINMKKAPTVLESYTDYTKASCEVIEVVEGLSGYDGVLLACFGDPGLFALKEICPVPIIGVGEAAFSLAQLLGYKFSVIAASTKAKPMMDQMVFSYRVGERLASIETLNLPIEDFLYNEKLLLEKVVNKSEKAMESGAEVIIFGCAGMTMLGDKLEKQLNVAVIDPIKAGIVMLLAIITGGFHISKTGLYEKL